MASHRPLDDSPSGKILKLLRHQATCSIQDLTSALGVTRTAIRQQLTALCAQGLVTTALVRAERGRPRTVYGLSEKGRALLPQLTEGLARILLEAVLHFRDTARRHGLLQQVSVCLGKQYAERMQGVTSAERLLELVAWLAEQGIMSEINQGQEAFVLTEYGCPYYGLAREHREVCALETAAMERALGSPVTLVLSQLDGHHCCQFRVQKSSEGRGGFCG